MQNLALISDSDLLAQAPALLTRERAAIADVIEYLTEIDRRRLYLDEACSCLRSYCIERLAYSEDEATKRVRVAQLAKRLPGVLDELRGGTIHLTGLFLLAPCLNEQNAPALLAEARGLSRLGIEQLIARWFPKPEPPSRIDPAAIQSALPLANVPAQSGRPTCQIGPGTNDAAARAKLEPRSAPSYRVQFAASAELYAKIRRAQELLSHVLPATDLPALFERAIDALIERELRQRRGAGGKRKRRVQKPGSRHIPVEIAAQVWERDGSQCTFLAADGRRCSERRFLTLEHQHPFALGGPPTVENLVLLCATTTHTAHVRCSATRISNESAVNRRDLSRRRGIRRSQPTQRRPSALRSATWGSRSRRSLEPWQSCALGAIGHDPRIYCAQASRSWCRAPLLHGPERRQSALGGH